jgi:hypothetical protein
MITTASSTIATNNGNYTEYVLAELKCASLRARLLVADIDSIDTALRGNLITTDAAIAWANDIGALGLIMASSAITLAST